MKAKKIAIIGECMVELRSHGNGLFKQAFGGDTLNTAIYLSRLTHNSGIKTSYFTGLGIDALSTEMLKYWKAENIDTSHVYLSKDKLPGLYSINTDEQGERSFCYWRSNSAAKYWIREMLTDELIAALLKFDMIYLSGISLAILPKDCIFRLFLALKQCRNQGVIIAFDNNYRPALWELRTVVPQTYEEMLELADIAFLTFDDERLLYGDQNEQQSIERAQRLGVKEIVVKRGGDACLVAANGEVKSVEPEPVSKIVDTTAAGDSFSAGYLAARLRGSSIEDAAKLAHKVAGAVIQHSGAIIDHCHMPQI